MEQKKFEKITFTTILHQAREELKIIEEVCQNHSVSLYDLFGNDRRAKIVVARRELAHKFNELGLSPNEIGILLGRRDRTTVLNLLGKLSTG